MRKMTSLAASYERQELPASLMQRLALMQQLALAAQANAHAGGTKQGGWRARRGPSAGAQAIVLAWFSLGVLSSGAVGAGAIYGLRAVAAGASPIGWSAWAKAPPVAPSPQAGTEWETVQLKIDRGARAPLALQITGAEAPVEVVLEGMPSGVRLSRGELRGGAWVLKQADLDGLHLEMDAGAPGAFDLKIGVLAPSGLITAGSIVQVRLVEKGEPKETASGADKSDKGAPLPPLQQTGHVGMADGAPTALVAPVPVDAPTNALPPLVRGDDKGGSRPGKQRTVTAKADTTGARTWPGGALALGAVSREPERQNWWQMPPSWSPFLVGQERP